MTFSKTRKRPFSEEGEPFGRRKARAKNSETAKKINKYPRPSCTHVVRTVGGGDGVLNCLLVARGRAFVRRFGFELVRLRSRQRCHCGVRAGGGGGHHHRRRRRQRRRRGGGFFNGFFFSLRIRCSVSRCSVQYESSTLWQSFPR